jgi:uncharacterized protein with GYD domain
MPTYITLLQYTQQGIEKIKDGPTRLLILALRMPKFNKDVLALDVAKLTQLCPQRF